MVVIKKFENTIPVDFGEFELKYVVNDENIQRLGELSKKAKDVEDLVNNLKGTTEDLQAIKELAEEIWVELFDEETFDKVYAFCGKSSIPTFLAVLQTIKGLSDELPNVMSPDKISKYLSN